MIKLELVTGNYENLNVGKTAQVKIPVNPTNTELDNFKNNLIKSILDLT
ncbi:hypothetical protein [Paraclostridium sordellii]|nr:hypothetical protein [Paeniclostridium sordellii]